MYCGGARRETALFADGDLLAAEHGRGGRDLELLAQAASQGRLLP